MEKEEEEESNRENSAVNGISTRTPSPLRTEFRLRYICEFPCVAHIGAHQCHKA
jgi:hypothetical protein